MEPTHKHTSVSPPIRSLRYNRSSTFTPTASDAAPPPQLLPPLLLLLSLFPLAAAACPRPVVVVVVGGFSRNSLHGYRVNRGGAVSQYWFLRKCALSSLLPPSLSWIYCDPQRSQERKPRGGTQAPNPNFRSWFKSFRRTPRLNWDLEALQASLDLCPVPETPKSQLRSSNSLRMMGSRPRFFSLQGLLIHVLSHQL